MSHDRFIIVLSPLCLLSLAVFVSFSFLLSRFLPSFSLLPLLSSRPFLLSFPSVPQEWIVEKPFEELNNPLIKDYFQIENNRYIPKSQFAVDSKGSVTSGSVQGGSSSNDPPSPAAGDGRGSPSSSSSQTKEEA